MNNPMQIQLSVEEALAYQKTESRLAGFVEGAQAMAEHVKRMKVEDFISSRKAMPPDPEKNVLLSTSTQQELKPDEPNPAADAGTVDETRSGG